MSRGQNILKQNEGFSRILEIPGKDYFRVANTVSEKSFSGFTP